MLELTQRNPLPAWFEFSFGARLGCRDLERREPGAARYRHHRRSPKEEDGGGAGLMGMGPTFLWEQLRCYVTEALCLTARMRIL